MLLIWVCSRALERSSCFIESLCDSAVCLSATSDVPVSFKGTSASFSVGVFSFSSSFFVLRRELLFFLPLVLEGGSGRGFWLVAGETLVLPV